jgi:hypothetical protein
MAIKIVVQYAGLTRGKFIWYVSDYLITSFSKRELEEKALYMAADQYKAGPDVQIYMENPYDTEAGVYLIKNDRGYYINPALKHQPETGDLRKKEGTDVPTPNSLPTHSKDIKELFQKAKEAAMRSVAPPKVLHRVVKDHGCKIKDREPVKEVEAAQVPDTPEPGKKVKRNLYPVFMFITFSALVVLTLLMLIYSK